MVSTILAIIGAVTLVTPVAYLTITTICADKWIARCNIPMLLPGDRRLHRARWRAMTPGERLCEEVSSRIL